MKDYTERLKRYWRTNDLAFITTFKKVNEDRGYFNHFINPTTGMKLFYPVFDDMEIVDRRVSFSYGRVSSLIDGDYYSVELEHTNDPKGKNNPYSLKIKKIIALDQAPIKKLLEESERSFSESTIYYGCYHKTSDKFAAFENVMFSESGDILMREGQSQKIFVSPKLPLKQNSYYAFIIKENKDKLSNAIPHSIEELEVNPYKEYVRLRFERLNNPEANKMIANLMREIGKGMYSSKQRMIFELLQNADDAPGKEKVEFHIDISGSYFFIMHDGAPFNKDDVEAITSAAESTKRGDNKKTGYKGIGFKSVFTDSTEVWIKSGGYQFAFQRNNDIFNDFDKFYFSGNRYIKYPDLLEEDKLKYRNQRLRFNGSTDIPWQVIPIWQDNIPSEFNDSNFNDYSNPVQIALKLGEQNINEYKFAIDNITKRPQFLLFLRNTSKFRLNDGITVFRKDLNQVIEIYRHPKDEPGQTYYYRKQIFEDIAVSDEAFSELNIGLKKQSKINDYNEISYYFTDLDGREIETIPPKLASASATEISFGISLMNSRISPEKEYLENLPKYSSLFAYLPMEDTRFQLPFLVNADFVPSSDRQRIQGDNLWNKYVMIKVAEKHVATLSFYAQEYLKDNSTYGSYLSLLLKTKLPEDDTAQQIIDSYNEKYLECVFIESFIVNDQKQTQLLSDTILDASGFTDLFGNELFYEIIKTEKRLPHPGLESSYLRDYEYLNVQIIDLKEFASNITPEICERLGEVIAEKALYKNPELLKWLNRLVLLVPSFGKIPFIVHNNSLFSVEKLFTEETAWIMNKNIQNYKSLFESIGYHTVDLQLEEYTNVNNYLLSLEGYFNDKTLAYERLTSNPGISKIGVSLKIKLIDFFQNSKFMSGIGEGKYFDKLRLFVDENRIARPLRQLLSPEGISEIDSLSKFLVNHEEFKEFTDELKGRLIKKDEVFTSFILNRELFAEWSAQFNLLNIEEYVQGLIAMYNWIGEEKEIMQTQWISIPWLYVDDETRFIECDKIFWSFAFNQMSPVEYTTIRNIFHNYKIRRLPVKECGGIIQKFGLKTSNISISDWENIKDLDTVSANTLLDWMESEGHYSSFFEEFTFSKSSEDRWNVVSLIDKQVFNGTDTSLKEYINSIPLLKTKFVELDVALCSESRDKLGLLRGDGLLSAIIESRCYDQKIAKQLPPTLSWKSFDKLVSNLSIFELKTETEYNGHSPEHIMLNSIIKSVEDANSVPEGIQKTIDCLRAKITVDQLPLSDYDLSDRIQFGSGDDRKVLKLSDVLHEHKGDSDVLDNLIESFTAINQKAKIRKLIFKTRQMNLDEICSKIEKETSPFYSICQIVFRLLYEKHNGRRRWSKKRFDEFWRSQGNESELQSAYKSFLDLIFEIDLTDLTNFTFLDLTLNNCVDESWALESEMIPQWLMEWVAFDPTKRLVFISKLGFNGIGSPIVKLRHATVSENYDPNTVIRFFEEAKPNTQLIWNTIKWLSMYNVQVITRNIDFIEQVNNYIGFTKNNLESVTIPLIESIDKENHRSYRLQTVSTESKLHRINHDEEFASVIYSKLTGQHKQMLFIDNSCGTKSSLFVTEVIQLTESIDAEELEKESKIWDAPFYKKWEHYDNFPILIFSSDEIPYKRSYLNIIINQFTNDLKVEYNGRYYISSFLRSDILANLPQTFPSDMLADLKEWHYKTLQNESLLDEDSFEYKEDIDRLLQDRLGLSQEAQQRENGNAKAHAVYFLDKNSFDVSNVEDKGTRLTNIIDPDGNYIDCIIRSAKGGLLYLDKGHWDMLENENTYLLVIYPGNTPRLFRNQMSLLDEELAENVLFRIPNSKQVMEINDVFDALESESHLILVTSEKMKESLFSKLKQKSSFKLEEGIAIGDDDFEL